VLLLLVSLLFSGSIVDSNCTYSGKSLITTSNVLTSWSCMQIWR
jgi:hypothetical protein